MGDSAARRNRLKLNASAGLSVSHPERSDAADNALQTAAHAGPSASRRSGVSPLQQQIAVQQAVAPVLHPTPSLASVIKSPCSDEQLCAALFGNRSCQFGALWEEAHAADDVPICYYCGEEVERPELKKPDAFAVLYTFLPADRQIQVESVQVICSACQRVKRFEQLLPLCAEAVACQTAASFPKLESLAKATLSRHVHVQPAERVNSLVQHFLEINNLDPVRHATSFQNALSLALAIFTTSRQTQWTLQTQKSSPKALFAI